MDKRRKFEEDVAYEAWARGLNPDRATECAEDCYYAGRTADECVDGLQDRMDRQRMQRQQEEEYRYQEQLRYEDDRERERQYFENLENPQ